MAAPDFKATLAQAEQAALDLLSHKADWKSYEADCGDDLLAIISQIRQVLVSNASSPAPTPAPVPPIMGEVVAGSILSQTWIEILAWLRSLLAPQAAGAVQFSPILLILVQAAITAVEELVKHFGGG